jgi:hypothetical protein
MNEETKQPDASVMADDPSQVIVDAAPPTVEPEPEVVVEEAPKEPQASWEFREEFGINNRMKEVIAITLSAANAERDVLLKKLEKLQYGSIKGR